MDAKLGRGSDVERGWRRSVITADALQGKKFNPVRCILPGFIADGATKTEDRNVVLLYDLCLASAAGRFVLGNMKPAEGEVL